MAFAKQGKDVDKSVIRYNCNITLPGIRPETYAYIVNGNDPNNWSDNPRHILDLLKRIVRVSVETMRIIQSFSVLNEYKA
ncbi:MAG: helicase [Methylococcaceae bacterium]|nr:helicase [Methylococcaceae bacterium]